MMTPTIGLRLRPLKSHILQPRRHRAAKRANHRPTPSFPLRHLRHPLNTLQNDILSNLVSSTSSSTDAIPPSHQYKYAVNSTIIQHLSDSSPTSSSTSTSTSANAANTTSAHSLATQPPNSHSAAASASGPTIGAPAEALGANEADARTLDTPIAGGVSDERRTSIGKIGGGVGGAGAGASSTAPTKGRRGMHSATGAYWNNETDGMWSFKYEGGEARGMDVVVCVIWVAV